VHQLSLQAGNHTCWLVIQQSALYNNSKVRFIYSSRKSVEIIIPDPRVTPTIIDAIHDVASEPSSKYHMNSTMKIPNVYVNPSAVKERVFQW